MKTIPLLLSTLIALLPATGAATGAVYADRAPSVSDVPVAQFLAFHDEVGARATKGDFRDLARSDRDALAAAQARIRALVAGKQRMTELDERERLEVFNEHQRVVALVDRAEESRVICEQVKRIGSHRHSVECRSVAERRRDREATQIATRTVRQWPY